MRKLSQLIAATQAIVWSVAVLPAINSCADASAEVRQPPGPPIECKFLRGNLILVPVVIEGAGPFDFLLDTGASTSFIHAEFARQLGLRPVDRVEVVSVTGTQILPRSFASRVAVGHAAAGDVEVLWSDLSHLRTLAPQARGVLGQNFLSHFDYVLDYRRGRVEFEPECVPRPEPRGQQFAFELREGRMVVELPVLGAAERTLRFVLDAGATHAVLFGGAARRFARPAAADEPLSGAQLTTDFGSQRARVGRVDGLLVGGTRISLPVALLPALASGAGRTEDGLLPLGLFSSVYVNNREACVVLNLPTHNPSLRPGE
jgi:predicted aspartyl protease